ncbi:cysteine hydrolase family protein [Trinickia diaoshuihuensis]|jgi:nicotinamidase-related amidase|uniref:cysteine hydrolase family protein n=1 Tax=Trinickia diaoshuihuensis TaxID=2292265 RepID=UPI000E222919|nr:cysteine hydrolase family protein [Trinickia diaoshuihuensis]
MQSSRPPRRALLILDMQEGLFNGPEEPYDRERILANVKLLIANARNAQAPIFAVRHTGPAGSPIEPGSPLTRLLADMELDPSIDRLFDKTRPNAFAGTGLTVWLKDAAIDELVIAGMKTEYCVDTTCRAAADMGFHPVLIADAHTCMDTPVLPAKSIIEHHNKTLGAAFATLICSTDCEF